MTTARRNNQNAALEAAQNDIATLQMENMDLKNLVNQFINEIEQLKKP